MTLRKMAEKAVREHRSVLAVQVRDRLRGKGFGCNEVWRMVSEWTGVSRATWNELLRRANEGYD